VKSLNELISEGLRYDEVEKQLEDVLSVGSTGRDVEVLQYYLRFVSAFEDNVPRISVSGTFDAATENALKAFQRAYGLYETGESDIIVWERLYDVYRGFADSIPDFAFEYIALPYPGAVLRVGSQGSDVIYVQENINTLAGAYTDIPTVSVSGYYSEETAAAVRIFQGIFGIPQTGNVSALTWKVLAESAIEIIAANSRMEGQFPGGEISSD
jgi:peptidoglycan hydrolase-like protein with peptidoglycan-binding domain